MCTGLAGIGDTLYLSGMESIRRHRSAGKAPLKTADPVRKAYKNGHKGSNRPTATNCGRSRNELRAGDVVADVIRARFAHKADVELAYRAGLSLRAAQYILAKRTSPSGDAVVALLQSDIGLEFLTALMKRAAPAWWRGFRRQMEISELRRLQALQQRKLEELERAAGD